jgi:hypothetical protein
VLDLDGSVMDFEVSVEALANRRDEAVVNTCVGPDQMNRKRGLGGGDVDPDKVSAVEPHNDEGVQQVKTDGWNNEQVHGGNVWR